MIERYLTTQAKEAELREWTALKAVTPPPDAIDIGGRGYPDLDIFDACDRLNAIDGICTLQSCSGHVHPDGSLSSGGLWLWLSEPLSLALYGRAFELSGHPLIEAVRTYYHPCGREIVDISFRGNNYGSLSESVDLIVGFFETLANADASHQHRLGSSCLDPAQGRA